MNHIANIAKKLPEYGLDAMLITSPSGDVYKRQPLGCVKNSAVFHGGDQDMLPLFVKSFCHSA